MQPEIGNPPEITLVSPNQEKNQNHRLGGPALEFWLKEYDVLRDLYTNAAASAQSIFNFYLTLITSVTGGVILLLQFTPSDRPTSSDWLVGGLFLFIAGIGSMYLSSISGRYAHLSRYAKGMDEIRKFLIQQLELSTPPIYNLFLAEMSPRPRRFWHSLSGTLVWLFPIGTFQFFIAAINSLSLAAVAWLALKILGIAGEAGSIHALVSVAVFSITYALYNFYSRLIMRAVVDRMNVRVDVERDLPFISGKH